MLGHGGPVARQTPAAARAGRGAHGLPCARCHGLCLEPARRGLPRVPARPAALQVRPPFLTARVRGRSRDQTGEEPRAMRGWSCVRAVVRGRVRVARRGACATPPTVPSCVALSPCICVPTDSIDGRAACGGLATQTCLRDHLMPLFSLQTCRSYSGSPVPPRRRAPSPLQRAPRWGRLVRRATDRRGITCTHADTGRRWRWAGHRPAGF